MKNEYELKALNEIESELKRFQSKLEIAKKSLQEKPTCQYQNHEFSACKRSALDLKKELTKITRFADYWRSQNK